MNQHTLLTAPEWEGVCPAMPGKFGPSYRKQIEVVEEWMPPAMRSFYEGQRWRECPQKIYSLYQSAIYFERQVLGVLDLSHY